jgi:sortase (surface protein transpeptidase)
MSRPVRPKPLTAGPRMPESVLRRRPAEIVTRTAQQRDRATPDPPAEVVPRRPVHPAQPAPSRTAPRPRRTRPAAPVRATGRRPLPLGVIAVILVFAGLFAMGAGLGAATGFDLSDLFKGPDKPPPRAFPVLEPSRPMRLTIPAIKVAAPILDVGLAGDGTVAVPPLERHNEAGWFDQGPTPGQFGPALIVGHADTRTGASVFHHLGRLKPGQRIEVLRADHQTAIFQVNSVEHHGKDKLPIQRVYGDYSRPSLRLVTCGGTWLGGTRGYSDNIIVFASLIGTKKE